MLVSLHLPKTAGTSFATALQQNFTPSEILRDYKDKPINTELYKRNKMALKKSLRNANKSFRNIKCIHGHFLPIKYLLLADKQDITFITWMRDPVERILSHYYYWQKHSNPRKIPALHKQMLDEQWTLERFCLGPELQNFYTQFLYGFPLEKFSFIGITEHFEQDLAYFSEHFLQTQSEAKMLNVGGSGKKGYEISSSLRTQIESHHAQDIQLYQRALAMREARIR